MMNIRTHAPGCLYTTSSSARCTCHWAKVIAEEERRPLPPEVLAAALQDRIHPTSGRLLRATPIKEAMTDKAITFTDEQGNECRILVLSSADISRRAATPDDLARAGYTPSAENGEVQRLCLEAARRTRELEALRALEQHVRSTLTDDPRLIRILGLLEAVDEARK